VVDDVAGARLRAQLDVVSGGRSGEDVVRDHRPFGAGVVVVAGRGGRVADLPDIDPVAATRSEVLIAGPARPCDLGRGIRPARPERAVDDPVVLGGARLPGRASADADAHRAGFVEGALVDLDASRVLDQHLVRADVRARRGRYTEGEVPEA